MKNEFKSSVYNVGQAVTADEFEKIKLALFKPMKDWMQQNYKHDRFYGRNKSTGWGDSYGDNLVKSYVNDLLKYGSNFISAHDSKSGETAYCPIVVSKESIAILLSGECPNCE